MLDHNAPIRAPKILQMPEPGNPAPPAAQTRQTKGKPSVNSTPAPGGTTTPEQPTPPKGPYYLGIDWFEATLSGGVVPIEDNDENRPAVNLTRPVPNRDGLTQGKVVLWLNQSKKTRHYRYCFDLLFIPSGAKENENRAAMLDEYLIGRLRAVPYAGNNLLGRSSVFQAINHVLYRADCWQTFDAAFAALGCYVHHLTRIDIALDGRGIIQPADAYYQQLMQQRYGSREVSQLDKIGRATYEINDWYTNEDGGLSSFLVGSKKSKKQIFGYAKGQRIETENKQYIRESWRASGLITDDGKDVERLELRLRKEGVDDLHVVDPATGELAPLQWERLRDAKYLAGAFRASVEGFYGFKRATYREDGKLKHRSRWEDVDTIDWAALESATVVRLPRTKRPSQTWRAKHASYKILSDCAVQSYLQDATINYVNEQIQKFTPSAEIVDNLAWGASLGLSEVQTAEVKRLAGLTATLIAVDVVDYLTDTVLPELPEVMAWAMAKEHHIDKYLERRVRKDIGAKEYPLHITPPAALTLNAAA